MRLITAVAVLASLMATSFDAYMPAGEQMRGFAQVWRWEPADATMAAMGRLDELDLSLDLSSAEQDRLLEARGARLAQLRLALAGLIGRKELGPPLLVLFEGWDASGKGGAIRRLVAPLDPRHVRVMSFGAPTFDEHRHHYLQRFVRWLPGRGGMAVFDRTWYGRVLVERVDGLATEDEWRRAYSEIAALERALADDGMILVKLWLHISADEQLRRFQARERDPLKSWKLTEADWHSRAMRAAYLAAIEEMVQRTDSEDSPWRLIPAESKRYARVRVIEEVIGAIEDGAARSGFPLPEPLEVAAER